MTKTIKSSKTEMVFEACYLAKSSYIFIRSKAEIICGAETGAGIVVNESKSDSPYVIYVSADTLKNCLRYPKIKKHRLEMTAVIADIQTGLREFAIFTPNEAWCRFIVTSSVIKNMARYTRGEIYPKALVNQQMKKQGLLLQYSDLHIDVPPHFFEKFPQIESYLNYHFDFLIDVKENIPDENGIVQGSAVAMVAKQFHQEIQTTIHPEGPQFKIVNCNPDQKTPAVTSTTSDVPNSKAGVNSATRMVAASAINLSNIIPSDAKDEKLPPAATKTSQSSCAYARSQFLLWLELTAKETSKWKRIAGLNISNNFVLDEDEDGVSKKKVPRGRQRF